MSLGSSQTALMELFLCDSLSCFYKGTVVISLAKQDISFLYALFSHHVKEIKHLYDCLKQLSLGRTELQFQTHKYQRSPLLTHNVPQDVFAT